MPVDPPNVQALDILTVIIKFMVLFIMSFIIYLELFQLFFKIIIQEEVLKTLELIHHFVY